MAPDDFKNLGFADDARPDDIPGDTGGVTAQKISDDRKNIN